ncbi:hypothetical protein BH11PSE2_BH11PSE2_10500 [soil metagenome]
MRFAQRLGLIPALIWLAACAAPQSVSETADSGGKIIGPPAERGVYLWQAEIFEPRVSQLLPGETNLWYARHRCGASLIAPDWVLTAAHCVDLNGLKPGDFERKYKIRVGLYSLEDNQPWMTQDIDRAPMPHPGWKGWKSDFAYDVALIHIKPKFGLPDPANRVRSIALAGSQDADEDFQVTGWGRHTQTPTNQGRQGSYVSPGDMSMPLRVAMLSLAPRTGCGGFRNAGQMPASHLCALGKPMTGPDGKRLVQDSCQGDSGGPLVQKIPGRGWQLSGVVSYGPPGQCGAPNTGGSYTDLTRPEIRKWICDITQAAGCPRLGAR